LEKNRKNRGRILTFNRKAKKVMYSSPGSRKQPCFKEYHFVEGFSIADDKKHKKILKGDLMILRFFTILLFLVCVAFADSPGPEYNELIPKSGVFLLKSVPSETVLLLQKVLSTGYTPANDEIDQLRFCRLMINKDNRFVEFDAALMPQILQDKTNTTTQYTLAGGLKLLKAAIGWREVSQVEIEAMKRSVDAPKKSSNK
jgi:hypothetical protein